MERLNEMPDYFLITINGISFYVEKSTFNTIAYTFLKRNNMQVKNRILSLIKANLPIIFTEISKSTYDVQYMNATYKYKKSK